MPECFDFFGQKICFPTIEDITDAFKQWAEENLIPALEDIVNQLLQSVTKIWDEYIKNITDNFTKGMQGVVDGIIGGAEDFFKPISKPISDFAKNIGDFVSSFPDNITSLVNSIAGIPEGIGEYIDGLGTSITDVLTRIPDTIVDGLSNFTDNISNTLGSLADGVNDAITGIGNQLGDIFNPMVETIAGLPDNISGAISSLENMLNDMASSITKGITGIPSELLKQATSFLNTYEDTVNQVIKFLSENLGKVAEPVNEFLGNLLKFAVEPMKETINGIFTGEHGTPALFMIIIDLLGHVPELIYDGFKNVIEYKPPADPEKATEAVKRWFNLINVFPLLEIYFRFVEIMLGIIGDIEVMGTHLPLRIIAQLKPFTTYLKRLNFNLGFIWLSWTIWSELFREAIVQPLKLFYTSKYQAHIPTAMQIVEYYRRGYVDEKQVIEWLKLHGYNEDWARLLVRIGMYYPPPSEILEWYRRRLVNEEFAKFWLTRYGIIEPLHKYYLKTAWKQLTLSMISDALIRNIISEEEFTIYARDLGYKDEDIEIIKKLLPNQLSYSLLFELYEWGAIDEDYLTQYLQQIGYRGQELLLMIELARIRAISDEVSLIKTRVLNLYEFGYYDKYETEQILTTFKIPREQADLLIRAKEYESQLNIVEDYVSSLLRLFRDGKIDEATLRVLVAPFIKDPLKLEGHIAYQRSLREKQLPYILPPVFKDRAEYVRRLREGLGKQIDYLEKLWYDEISELDQLINFAHQELSQVPEDLREGIERHIKYLENLKKEREQYYANLIGILVFYERLYVRLLQIYGGV